MDTKSPGTWLTTRSACSVIQVFWNSGLICIYIAVFYIPVYCIFLCYIFMKHHDHDLLFQAIGKAYSTNDCHKTIYISLLSTLVEKKTASAGTTHLNMIKGVTQEANGRGRNPQYLAEKERERGNKSEREKES